MKKINNYFKLENILIDDYKIKENDEYKIVSLFSNIYEKFIFAVIERYENNYTAFPSQKQIAQSLLCSKSQVEKTIKSLREKNLIIQTKHPENNINIYTTCNLEERYFELYGSKAASLRKNFISQEKSEEISNLFDDIIKKTKIKLTPQIKKNLLTLIILKNISEERIEEVISYTQENNKEIKFIYPALKYGWILYHK